MRTAEGPYKQTWTVEEIRVKDPCFFPRRLAAIESHNFAATSAAFNMSTTTMYHQ
jgi:hypothetical protein